MNLFFYYVNNNNMKKIIFFMFCFLFINRVFAIENIEIDNENIIPKFDKSIKKYNYFTYKDEVNVKVFGKLNESISGNGKYKLNDGKNEIIIVSNNDKYIINVFKNYKKENNDLYLVNLSIEGYDINFDRNITEYTISINDEDHININYELSNDNGYAVIYGNGNFNKSDNIIEIDVGNDKYFIHVYKTKMVSNIESDKITEISSSKKEIIKLIIISLSCVFVFIFFYCLFIDRRSFIFN